MNRLGVLGIFAVAAAAGCGDDAVAGTCAVGVGTARTLAWSPCADTPEFQCATLTVPLDWADTSASCRTIELAVIRRPASYAAGREGTIFVHFGGPSESGVGSAPGLFRGFGSYASAVTDRFDLIAWDTRGTYRSSPIDCGVELGPWGDDPEPDDDAEWTAIDARARAFASGCEEHAGALLPFVDTESTARDMDAIREALGDEKISLLGMSYGTLVGATYATLFPERVRAFVLDAGNAPSTSMFDRFRAYAISEETELTRFLAACEAAPTNPFHGGEPAGAASAAFDRLAAAADDATLPAGPGVTLDEAGFWRAVLGSLSAAKRTELAAALAAAEAGDWSLLAARIRAGAVPPGVPAHSQYESRFATWALDTSCPDGYDLAAHRAFVDSLTSGGAPRTGAVAAQYVTPCIGWSVRRPHPATPIDAHAAPPMLVIAGVHDPNVSHAHSEALVTALNNGSCLKDFTGEGHTALQSNDPVVLSWMVDFLDDPSSPPVPCL